MSSLEHVEYEVSVGPMRVYHLNIWIHRREVWGAHGCWDPKSWRGCSHPSSRNGGMPTRKPQGTSTHKGYVRRSLQRVGRSSQRGRKKTWSVLSWKPREGIFQGHKFIEPDGAMSLTFSQGSAHLIFPTDW